jgi:LysR family transcriptional regulator of gallate degradation
VKPPTITWNIRHLRTFLAVANLQSVTLAAGQQNVSQPAVTQAMTKLERDFGGPLFQRSRQGIFLTDRGAIVQRRLRRAFDRLDPVLTVLSPRMPMIATTSQLSAVIAMHETENFTLAARKMGVAQPTVHRAISQLENESTRPLFQRTAHGLVATTAAKDLATVAGLTFTELEQTEADLAEFDGREGGQIVIGSLPLSRSVLLPQALAALRRQRPNIPIKVVDGPYDDLLVGLRRGAIDVIVGALRDDVPIADVRQETLFNDTVAIVCRPDHPLVRQTDLGPADFIRQLWVVPRSGTPLRAQFDAFFSQAGLNKPASIIEAGSILFMREILSLGDFLGCISEQQAEAEIARGLIARLDVKTHWPGRAIGLTTRVGWLPTHSQEMFLSLLRGQALQADAPPT